MSDMNNPPHSSGQPEWYPPVPGSTWTPGTAGPMAPPQATPMEVPTAAPAKASRKRWIAIGGAGALLAAGTFAIVSMTGGAAKGGADSPEQAIQGMVDSINNEDMIGAMDFVLPGERRVLKDPMIDMVNELTRIEVLSDKAKLDKVAGFDIEIDIDFVEVDEVADDISTISLTGTTKVTVDKSIVPIGDLLVDEAMDGEQPTGTETTESAFGGDDNPEQKFAVVQRDGRWYVSMFFSIAEAARDGRDVPTAEEAIKPIGADSPEGAVENMFDAIEETDLETMIAVLNPDEAEALQRYAPIFLQDGQDMVDEAISDGGVKIRITDTEFKAETDGDRARVSVVKLTAEAAADGESARFVLADGCATIEVPDSEPQKSCADDANTQLEDMGLGSLSTLSKDSQITVSRVDGKWYVSPVGTVLDAMLTVLREIDRKDIEKFINDFEGIGEFDDVFGTSVDEQFPADEFPIDETFDTLDPNETFDTLDPNETFDTLDPNETFDTLDPNEPYVIVDNCVYGEGSADPKACLDAAVAAGTITVEDIPADVRFPECGMQDFYLNTFDATDAEFTQMVTEIGACFAGHVAAGELGEFSVPYDVQAPECWQGVNPYLLEDDASTAAFEAYYDCALG
jgi:hypothetical protein